MALSVQEIEREFVYNGTILDDPGPSLSPEDVKEFYAHGIYPELNQAVIEDSTKNNKVTYTFRKAVGTKG